MDLNYLYHREQISLFHAGNAVTPEARASHAGLARGYSRRILTLRTAGGALLPTPITPRSQTWG